MSYISNVIIKYATDENNNINSLVDVVSTSSTENKDNLTLIDDKNRNSVLDSRMGHIMRDGKCLSCYKDKSECNGAGHRGIIHLKYSLFNVLAIKEIKKWLKVICLNCSNIYNNIPKGKDKLTIMSKNAVNFSICTNKILNAAGREIICNTVHPKITSDKNIIYITNSKEESHKILFPDEVKKIFSKIPKNVINILGIHPNSYIFNSIVVPPNATRPPIRKFNSNNASHNEITTFLQMFIKSDKLLSREFPEKKIYI